MGNYFQSNPTKAYDVTLIKFLKKKDIASIGMAYDQVQEDYLGAFTLNLEEFQEVFGGFFEERAEEFFLVLENKQSKEGVVDIFESFAIAVIFCGNTFEEKTLFIYNMFDFDKSGKIEKKELVMIFQSFIRALCKLVNLPLPTLKQLEDYASNMFQKIDRNEDQVICYEELMEWLKNNYDLQDFLLRYARIQTYENATRRYKEHFESFLSKWKETAEDEYSLGSEKVREMLGTVDEEDREYLVKVLQDSSFVYCAFEDKSVFWGVYYEVMSAYSCFAATDINHDRRISLKELRYLIFAYEQRKESQDKLDQLMAELDKDGSHEISLQEWIKFLSVEEGSTIFKGELRREFRRADADNSGYLDKQEVKNLVKKVLARKNHNADLDKLSFKVFDQLDVNEDNRVSWQEFKDVNYDDWTHLAE